jgi:transaldolase
MKISADSLRIKIFADGADKDGMLRLAKDPLIKGFTTNPTLMRKAGVTNYEAFARDILATIVDRPISFEVLSDAPAQMEEQATKLSGWGKNVYVKIPITNTAGDSSANLIGRLKKRGIKVNVTAVTTLEQVQVATECLAGGPPANISVFAGRIADTGRDPVPLMRSALEIIGSAKNIEMIWASPREILNVVQADQLGCQIITVTHDILKKLSWLGRDLEGVSLDTVKMFTTDAREAGFTL